MFEFNVSKYMKKIYNKGVGSRIRSGTFMATLIVKELKISVEHGRVVTTLTIIKH
jgi:hypothetical protein